MRLDLIPLKSRATETDFEQLLRQTRTFRQAASSLLAVYHRARARARLATGGAFWRF